MSQYPLYRDALAMFGTWQNALAQADVNRDRLYYGTKNPRLTQATALELLSQRILVSGVPTLVSLACENQYLTRYLIARFGSLQTALNLASATTKTDVQPASS